jgi:hypothetical protein
MDFQRDVTRQIEELREEIDRLKRSSTPQDWTPTVTQGAGVTVAVGHAVYWPSGPLVFVSAAIGLTSAGTGGNVIVIGNVPAAIAPSELGLIGAAIIIDAGTTDYHAGLYAAGSSDWRMKVSGNADYLGAAPAYTIANGDSIEFKALYQRL